MVGRMRKVTWIGLCVVVLVVVLPLIDPQDEHSLVLLFVPMIALSFPSGFVLLFIFGGLAYMFSQFGILRPFEDGSADNIWQYSMLVIYWMAFVAVGYVQWFSLIPYVKDKLRRRTN